MSRCGSTLAAANAGGLVDGNIVLSEADPIDAVLRAPLHHSHVTDVDRRAWLQAIVSALGQRRHADEAHLFIKFESWSVLELALIREAFPDVPWVFLYRDPVEVLVSQLRLRGRTMSPGPFASRYLGMDLVTATRMDPDEYCARLLARLCELGGWTNIAMADCSFITGSCPTRSSPPSPTFSSRLLGRKRRSRCDT